MCNISKVLDLRDVVTALEFFSASPKNVYITNCPRCGNSCIFLRAEGGKNIVGYCQIEDCIELKLREFKC